MDKEAIIRILEKHITLHSIRQGYGVFNITSFGEIAQQILDLQPQVDGEQELRPGLLDTFAREIGQHAENCNWDSCSASEQEAAYRSAKYLLAKATPIIKSQVAREIRRDMFKALRMCCGIRFRGDFIGIQTPNAVCMPDRENRAEFKKLLCGESHYQEE